MHREYAWEYSVMRNSEGWLELGLIYHFELNKGKGVKGFWASG